MTGTTDFIPFALGSGANVEDQGSYLAEPAVQGGFTAGLASAKTMNKVWRQSSFISSCIATFVANTLNINVADDANVSNFINNLTLALVALITQTQGNFRTCDGSPQGQVAGQAGTLSNPPDLCEDVLTGNVYVCTVSGNAAAAQWTLVSAGPSAPGIAQIGGVAANDLTSWSGNGAVKDSGIKASQVMITPVGIPAGDFPISNPPGGFSDSGASTRNVVIYGIIDQAHSDPNNWTVNTTPAITSLVAGQAMIIVGNFGNQINQHNTGAVTLNVNGIGSEQVAKDTAAGTGPLSGGELLSGATNLFAWDGSIWHLIGNAASIVGASPIVEPNYVVANAPYQSLTPPANPSSTVAVFVQNLTLFTQSLAAYSCSQFTGQCNLAINGINGLDVGSVAGNSGYYFHIISNGNGSFGTIASLSSRPTLPGGYGYWACIGWAPTDSAGNLYRFISSTNNTWFVPTPGTNTASFPVLVSGQLSGNISIWGVSGSLIIAQALLVILQVNDFPAPNNTTDVYPVGQPQAPFYKAIYGGTPPSETEIVRAIQLNPNGNGQLGINFTNQQTRLLVQQYGIVYPSLR